MKIKTITCHEVYNHGASLQEYALLKYLENLGHEAETIHYKPGYLCDRYKFWHVANEKYEKYFFTKLIYLSLKLPQRIKFLKRKIAFDKFASKYIKTTSTLYRNNEDLKINLPKADVYICGSDQIWNSSFENGKDPAFYLDFVPQDKLKLSYAASFAIDEIDENIKRFVKEKVSMLNFVSVRESSGITILKELDVDNVTQVLDPVFLLDTGEWINLEKQLKQKEDYIFVYDFDSNPLIKIMADKIKKQTGWKIFTVNENIKYADKNYRSEGPDSFLYLVRNAKFVMSNSFHAVAFSIIFKKDFVVFNRVSKINTRMRDMLASIDLQNILILDNNMIQDHKLNNIDYEIVNIKLKDLINISKTYLKNALQN